MQRDSAMTSRAEVATHRGLTVEVNDRVYRLPGRPVVVVCFDGCDPAYLAAAEQRRMIPNLSRMMQQGFSATALAAVPTFTNPNNVSIVCGAPPAVHGISGNYYLDRSTGREVMMLDEAQMRAETVPGVFSRHGVRVAVVTAKDKLRRALARGLNGIACSAEMPAEAWAAIDPDRAFAPAPGKYSGYLSVFVLEAGIRLLEREAADIIYLSLSDFIQHAHAPDAPAALAFMAQVDARIGRMLDLGALVGIVADHGMTDMCHPDGAPRVVYLGDLLDEAFGPGATRVICPITDPFGRHHASLGGFVRVYVRADGPALSEVLQRLVACPGVELALDRAAACARFQLPVAEEADIVVLAERGVAIGGRADQHDLSQLAGARLRSHGSLHEQRVPFILSHPLSEDYRARAAAGLRVWDIFDFAMNGACS